MKKKKAIFAGGCFWHIQEEFDKVPGVIKTTVGYTGGTKKKPTYEEVSSKKTGHAEAIEIIYDADKVSYGELLAKFFSIHNPTTKNRQGFDIGTNYRSAIFYINDGQKKLAKATIKKYQESFEKPIVTEIVPATRFYPAEEHHQKYNEKRGKTCKI
ncbi:peptide-methionine (S)-S-oxide reductase MsrA [Candidatus Pacearchaeota archaeon]|nr:peptide-methionine (S)-S-oxide reductase MsrA [Candidatus Pacearchaeota archaeon]